MAQRHHNVVYLRERRPAVKTAAIPRGHLYLASATTAAILVAIVILVLTGHRI